MTWPVRVSIFHYFNYVKLILNLLFYFIVPQIEDMLTVDNTENTEKEWYSHMVVENHPCIPRKSQNFEFFSLYNHYYISI